MTTENELEQVKAMLKYFADTGNYNCNEGSSSDIQKYGWEHANKALESLEKYIDRQDNKANNKQQEGLQ